MTTERLVRIFAGAMILVSIALTLFHSQWWLLLTGFVGLNLMQSGFTRFCPLDSILQKAGLPSCGMQRPSGA